MPEVRSIKPLSVQEWHRLDRRPAPTFFARPAWSLAWADADPAYVPEPVECGFDDGSWCIVPVARVRSGLGWRIHRATAFGGYTAALAEDGSLVEPAYARAAYQAILARPSHSVYVTPWPLAAEPIGELDAKRAEYETSIIDLAGGAEAALARMDGNCRRMAGQATRRGVHCERAAGPEAIDRYYAILEESVTRWGRDKPPFTKRLLEALVARGKDDVQIWFAVYEGEPIAGGVMLYGADEAYFWSAAMRTDFGTLRPSNALNVALINDTAARGIRWYNLGSSEGLPGVARFKDSLGAVRHRYVTWKREHRAFSLYHALRTRRRRSS